MVSTYDLCLVIGTFFFVLALPSLLNAWVEGRTPRFGALLSLGGLVLIGVAVSSQSYAAEDLPDVFARVFGRLIG